MTQETPEQLRWSGAEAISRATELIAQGKPVSLQLPPESHHALATRLLPSSGQTATVDLTGGAELLDKAAEIRGCEILSQLAEAVRAGGAAVRVVSPSPQVHLRPR